MPTSTPFTNLLSQFQRDASAFSLLANRRNLGEKGLDEEIEQMRQAMDVKWAILKGMREGEK